MNSLLALEQQLLLESQNMLIAGNQQLAGLNAQFDNPFGGAGFAANQVVFSNQFHNDLAIASLQVAALLPNNVVPFTPAEQSAALSGAFNQGTAFVNQLGVNADIRDFSTGQIAGQIGGVGSFFLPDGSFVGDFSTAPAFQFFDPNSGQVFASNVFVNDPNLVALQPAFGF